MTADNYIQELAIRWQDSGLEKGDIVLLHSDVRRSLISARKSGVRITPGDILESFIEAIGTEGTLLIPLFNFDFKYTKLFEINNTKSQMGVLTEVARSQQGIIRTGHPVYSFGVLGDKSKNFSNINNVSAYGDDSPFAILHRLKGKVASLDLDDQNSMTFYHYIEEMNQVDYRYFKKFEGTYIDADNNRSWRTYEIYVRDETKNIQTYVNPAGELLWRGGYYSGCRPLQDNGLRTISAVMMFDFVTEIIKTNKAENLLYRVGNEK